MKVITASPEEIRNTKLLSGARSPRRSGLRVPDPEPNVSNLESMAAGFERENTVGSTLESLKFDTDATAEEAQEAERTGFNPYSYVAEEIGQEELQDVMPELLGGALDDAKSPRQAKAIINKVRAEKEREERISANPIAGFIGGMAGAVFDPVNLIPFAGVTSKATRAGRLMNAASDGAITAGLSEGVLQSTQETRGWDEAIMNIGMSSVIGGGVGYFSPAAYRSSTLHPDNQNNPLSRENLYTHPEVIRDYDGNEDILSPEELSFHREEADSVGAARTEGREPVSPEDTKLAREDTPDTAVGKAARKAGDAFYNKTIVGRVSRSSSSVAREIGMKMVDYGGVLTKGMFKGRAHKAPAEAIKEHHMARVNALSASILQSVRQMKMEVGRKVTERDVINLTQRELFDIVDEELHARLVEKHGKEGFEKLRETARQNAEDIHYMNEVFENEMVKMGILRDEAKATHLKGEVERLRDEVRKLKEQDAPKTEIDQARSRRDSVVKDYQAELRKAVPKGRDYGHAQMWNRDVIVTQRDEFKAFLRDVLALRPDEDWLDDQFEMSLEELETLKTTDRDRYDQIIEAWAGDAWYHRIAQAENAQKAADERLKQSKLDLMEAARAAGMMKREEANLTLQEARKRRDELNARVEKQRAEVTAKRKEASFFKKGVAAAQKQTADRKNLGSQELEQLEKTRQTLERQEGRAADIREDVETDPTTPIGLDGKPRVNDSGDVQQSMAKIEATEARLARQDSLQRIKQERIRPETARQQGRAEEVANELARSEKRLDELQTRHDKLETALREVEFRRERAKLRKQDLNDAVSQARKDRNIAAKDAKQAKKALLKSSKATPLDQMIDDIYENLTTIGRASQGIIDRIADYSDKTTGRVKERVLDLDTDQRRQAFQRGWLKDDLPNVLYAQYEQASAELALREALDIGPEGTHRSWSDVLKRVEEDFQDKIDEAESVRDQNNLQRSRDITLDDMIRLRDRLRQSTVRDDGVGGILNWLSSKVRQWTFVRFVGGFLVSSLTDSASFNLRHGSMAKALRKYGKSAAREAFNMKKAGLDQTMFQRLVASQELGGGAAAAAARRWGSEDVVNGPYGQHGFGVGRTRAITGAIDQGGEVLSQVSAHISGLPAWNRMWKVTAGHMMAHRIKDDVARFSQLSDVQRADLASVGIGKAEAARLHKEIEAHGTVTDGRFDPGLENWSADNARIFEMAIMRDMNRSVNTPGIGDTPRLMDEWWGKLWLQFQTFAFTFLNRTVYPMSQRLSRADKQAMQAASALLSSTMMVVVLKDVIKGNDPSERFKQENFGSTLHEVFDRSGIMGWTSPYVSGGLKFSGLTGASRFARNNWLTSMTGVNTNVLRDVGAATVALRDMDPDAIEKMALLAPLSTQARLIGRMTGTME